jgi:hypothetical protein
VRCKRILDAGGKAWDIHGKFSTLWMPYAVLAGLAIEGAVKACWAADGRLIVVDGKLKQPRGLNGQKIDGHDTRRLAIEVGVPLSPKEEELCDTLYACVAWGGKYPTPLSAQEWKGIHASSITAESVARVFKKASDHANRLAAGYGSKKDSSPPP